MAKHRFHKDIPLLPVTAPVIGESYHVSWGKSHGVVGVCVYVIEDQQTVILRTPTGTRFKRPVAISDLRHTRKNQVKNPH